MPAYTIRPVQVKDIPSLIQLCREHAAFEQNENAIEPNPDNLRRALFSPTPDLGCLVADTGATLLGYASYMRQYTTWDACHYLYLDCLYLRPEVRRQGIGYQLMIQIRHIADEWQCDTIQWQTPDFNMNAIRFYEKLGAYHKPKARFFWTASD